jgi:hypothetical protein
VQRCPYCDCGDRCGRESTRIPDRDRYGLVLEAVLALYSKHRWACDLDPLYLAQELVLFGYFPESDPPSLVDVGSAQDIVRDADN